jgi:uncharacterized membrane protein YeaQ/YmgE (transglycosylase-associated protein family)
MSPTMQLILSLIGGGIGGYMAGAVLKNNLGSAGNVIVGSIGGGVSEKILTSTGVLSGSVVEQVVGSGIGGVVLVLIVRALKRAIIPPSRND